MTPPGPRPTPPLERIHRRAVYADQGYATPCRIPPYQPKGDGYWRIGIGSNLDGSRRSALTHLLVWEHEHGPVPAGYNIDHLCCDPAWCTGGDECPHRRCTEPTHLAAKTIGANVLRGNGPSAQAARRTHCPQGHPYAGENLYLRIRTNGRLTRECRTCIYERDVRRGRFKSREPA